MATLSSKTGLPISVVNQNTQSPIRAGTIMSFAGATTPTGWLDCDGSAKLKSAYPELFAQLSTTWNDCWDPIRGIQYTNGDALRPLNTTTEFRLPDLRGAFQRGAGGAANTAGVTTTLAGFQADLTARNGLGVASSVVTDPGHFHDYNDSQPFNDVSASIVAGPDHLDRQDINRNTGNKTTGITVVTTLTVGDAETRPDSVGVKYIIKAFDESFNLAGFALATPTTAGMVAARKGQTGLLVTNSAAGASTVRALGIYYQDQDGAHRLKFNIVQAITSKTLTSETFTVTGVTFKNTSGFSQSCSAWNDGTKPVSSGVCNPNTSSILIYADSSATTTKLTVSGDVELDSKPTWA